MLNGVSPQRHVPLIVVKVLFTTQHFMTPPAFLPLYLFHSSSSLLLLLREDEVFLCQFSSVYSLRFIVTLFFLK